jgi:hypothetical protein
MLVDNNTITEDEAEIHPQKNRILKALGSQNALEPNSATRPFKMKAGDLLLLCSDGLCSMVVDEAIEQLIDSNDLQGSINQLHSMAMNNGGKDNITIILLKVIESPHSTSDFTHYTTKYQNNITNTQNIPRIDNPSIETQGSSKNNQKMLIGVIASLLVFIGVYFTIIAPGKESNGVDNTQVNTKDTEHASIEIDTEKKDDRNKIIKTSPDITIISKKKTTTDVEPLPAEKTIKEEKSTKKVDAEKFKNKYLSLCTKYQALCDKKKTEKKPEEKKIIISDIEKTNIELDKIWADWNNTGLRQVEDKECDCN